MIHETACEALGVITDIELDGVRNVQCLELVKARKHDFLSLGTLTAEKVAVRFLTLVVENISALIDERLSRCCSLLQILLCFRHSMVLSPCTLKKGCTRLHCKRHPLGHTGRVCILCCRNHLDRLIKVSHHLVHHKTAVITGLVEECLVCRLEHLVIVRHITETHDLLIVEVCTEEVCDTLVLGPQGLIFAV